MRRNIKNTLGVKASTAVVTAVVTGASSGLGAEFARQLAGMGFNCILIARRRERLEALAAELRACGVRADVMPVDLARTEERAELAKLFARDDVMLLVNSAGLVKYRPFVDTSLEDNLAMIEVNVAATVELSLHAAREFRRRRSGGIINIASLAAFKPFPNLTVYAATKSFVKEFTECLALELASEGVRVAVVCPGDTQTEMLELALDRPLQVQTGLSRVLSGLYLMSAQECVRSALAAFAAGKRVIVTGRLNWWLSRIMPLLPRRWIAKVDRSVTSNLM